MSNSVSINNIFKTIKSNALIILACIIFAIMLSFYYNKSFKQKQFSYSISFNVLSKWDANKIGISNYDNLQSLINRFIIEYLAQYSPLLSYQIKSSIEFDDKIELSFKSYSKINTDNFLEKINKSLKENIITSQNAKFENLLKEMQFIRDNIKDNLINLENRREILDEYGQIFNELENDKNKNNEYLKFNENYKNLEIDIRELEHVLNRFNESKDNEIDFIKIGMGYIASDSKQQYQYIKQQYQYIDFQELQSNLQAFKNSNKPIVISVSDWKKKDNNFSNLEIIIMGFLFGLFFSFIIVFVSSNYFKQSIFYPK